MKVKLIASLLLTCVVLSLGSAMAQSDTSGSMDKPISGITNKMAGGMDQPTLIIAGKVDGTVTAEKMVGMEEDMNNAMGSAGKKMAHKFSGDMLVVKDIANKTETTMLIGKMDGITKRVVIIGKTQYESGMSVDNQSMNGMSDMSNADTGMVGMSRGKEGMNGMTKMAGSIDNKVGAMDNQKVIVTGNISCLTVGKMYLLGQPGDLKEMSYENVGMNVMSDDGQSMTRKTGNMDNMTGGMENSKVIATATIKCKMTGKMIVIGKLSDIKKEMMEGSEKENMQGAASSETGVVGVSKEDIKGAVVSKAGTAGYSEEGIKGAAGYKAGAVGASKEDLTLIMTGITRCKITGINMVVIGKMDEMAGGAQTGIMDSSQSQIIGQQSGMQSGMIGQKINEKMENMTTSTVGSKSC